MKTVITCILEVETEPDGESDELYDQKHREMERRLAVAQEELELLVVKLVKRRIPESHFDLIINP